MHPWPLLLALAAGAAPPVEPPPGPVPGDAHDLIFLHPARPYRIRLHMQVRGTAFRREWNDTVDHLFRHLDANGDGKLTRDEVRSAPSGLQWRQMIQGVPTLDPDQAPDWDALAKGRDGVDRDRFRTFYTASDAGPLQVLWGWLPRPDSVLSDALFRHLDTDHDGALSRRELLDAGRVLGRLDSNDDELIAPAEITAPNFIADPALAYTRGAGHGLATGGLPFYLLPAGTDGTRLADALLSRYDRDGDRKLSPAEVGLPPDLFARLDANGDGKLEATELARWPECPPDLALLLPLEPRAARGVSALPGACPDFRLTSSRNGGLLVDVRDCRFEVAQAEPGRRAPARPRPERDRFAELDTNRDGYLDSKEVFKEPFDLVGLLRLADRDGDGRVSRKEYDDFLALRRKVHAGSAFLRLDDRGRTLFGMLDSDGDGVLGLREVRSAWARLEPWTGKGGLKRDGVPRVFRLTLSHGEPLLALAEGAGAAGVVTGAGPARLRRRERGPLWFRKMDRNGDGDVSEAEFLGPRDVFRKIDLDGDGLISPEEAEKAEAWLKKKRE